MSWNRVYALVLRHWYLFPRSLDRVTDTFFWPVVEVFMWVYASMWLATQESPNNPLTLFMLTALVSWRIVFQSSYELGINIIEECWNRNFTNLFASPLTKFEWLIASLFVSVIKLAAIAFIVCGTIWLLYALNIFSIGTWWIPCLVSLTLSGWTIGFLSSGLILRLGIRAQALAWTVVFVFLPLSAVYYPLLVLPPALQTVAAFLPMTHVFEGIRALMLEGTSPRASIIRSLVLNACYLPLALWFFNQSFEWTRQRGFDHLE